MCYKTKPNQTINFQFDMTVSQIKSKISEVQDSKAKSQLVNTEG